MSSAISKSSCSSLSTTWLEAALTHFGSSSLIFFFCALVLAVYGARSFLMCSRNLQAPNYKWDGSMQRTRHLHIQHFVALLGKNGLWALASWALASSCLPILWKSKCIKNNVSATLIIHNKNVLPLGRWYRKQIGTGFPQSLWWEFCTQLPKQHRLFRSKTRNAGS